MKKAIGDLWKIFIGSIRDIQEPIGRFIAGFAIVIVVWLVVYSLSALVVHGIVDLIEVIANAIVTATTGIAPPK